MRIFSFLQEKVLVLAENDLVENLRRLLCSQSLLLDGKREPKCADMFPWAVFFMITGNYFARKVLAQGCIGENENILVVGGDFSSAAVPVPEHQRGRTWHFRASSFRPSHVPSETSQLCYRICLGAYEVFCTNGRNRLQLILCERSGHEAKNTWRKMWLWLGVWHFDFFETLSWQEELWGIEYNSDI